MRKWCGNRVLLVAIVWLWMFIGTIATIVLIAYVKGLSPDLRQIVDMLSREPYLASYGEVVGIGSLPLLISLVCRDSFKNYGVCRQGLFKSLILAVPPATTILAARIIFGGFSFESFDLEFPYNVWYAFLGVFAYGPLEVFFIVWLIVNTDKILGSLEKMISPGLLITVLVFGLSHVILSPQGGLPNAVKVTIILIIFMLLGLIFKYTKNSIGPMVAWTLINGQISYLLVGCLT